MKSAAAQAMSAPRAYRIEANGPLSKTGLFKLGFGLRY